METAAAAAAPSSRSCVDRLGDLPDCLLHGILSFLGSRQAVQTTALSRRWRHVWRSVPCVDIDQREFPSVPRVDIDPRYYLLHGLDYDDDRGWNQLVRFANRMTTLRPGVQVGPAPLDAFRLHLVGRGPFDDWVHFSMMRRPAAADVHYAYGSAMNLPPFLTFSLDPACADITSRLTRLRLFGLSLADDFAEQIRDRCPVLENLHVESCVCCCPAIASPTLKTLAIVLTHHDYRSAPLLLVLPRLVSLRLVLPFGSAHGYPVAIAPPENNHVVQASLCISDTDGEELGLGQPVTKYKRRFLKSMYDLLLQLPNVRNLVLSGFTTMALLRWKSQEFPLMRSLRSLLLDGCDVGANFFALTIILRNAPNLEGLRLHRCKSLDPPNRGRWKTELRRSCSIHRRPILAQGKKLESIEVKYRRTDIPHMAKVLLEILKGTPKDVGKMAPTQWRCVKRSSTTQDDRIIQARKMTKAINRRSTGGH